MVDRDLASGKPEQKNYPISSFGQDSIMEYSKCYRLFRTRDIRYILFDNPALERWDGPLDWFFFWLF